MTKEQLFTFIKDHKLAVLSTISAQGAPQSALIGIAVTAELEIVFDTVKSSRKYGNLATNPAATFVVGCTSETTLQYEAWRVSRWWTIWARNQGVYFATWPDGPSRLSWPGICYWLVKPKWIRFSDYGETPAAIEEFEFGS
jgi:hypothetical protein